jgi:hypothetical protein
MKQILRHALLFTALAAPAAQAQLDERCTVSILNQTAQVRPDGSWIVNDIPATLGPVRARAVCRQNGVTRVGTSDFLDIPAGDGVDDVPIYFEEVKPVPPIPVRMTLSSTATDLAAAGETVQLTATTTYNDGSTRNVSSTALGTVFLSSNPNVASVSPTGLVTAHSSGNVIVSATNEGTLALVRITIASIVDSDGDGMPDDYETVNGLKPFDPSDARSDDDYDGLTAIEEYRRGTNPTSYDSDADGVTDGLEVQLGTDPLDPASYDLARALVSIRANPAAVTVAFDALVGSATQQVRVDGIMTDGYHIDLTAAARGTTYTSSNAAIVNPVVPDGLITVVGPGSATLTIANGAFSTTVPVNVTVFTPAIVGTLAFSPANAQSIAVAGNYAYVGFLDGRLRLVNIMDRTAPRVDATLVIPNYAGGRVVSIGTRVYLADPGGVTTVNVEVPTNPVIVRRDLIGGTVRDMCLRGDQALMFATDTGVRFFRVNDFTIFATVPVFSARHVASAGPTTQGGYSVAIDANGVLHVMNIIASPTVIRTVSVGSSTGVRVWGDFAYVSSGNGLRTYDIGVSPPRLLTTLGTPFVVSRFDLRDGYAFAHRGTTGAAPSVIDVGDVGRTIDIATLPNATTDSGMDMISDARHLYDLRSGRLVITKFFGARDDDFFRGTLRIEGPPVGAQFAAGSTIPIEISGVDNSGVMNMWVRINSIYTYIASKGPRRIINYPIPFGATQVDVILSGMGLDGVRAFDARRIYTVFSDVTPPAVQITAPTTGGSVIRGQSLSIAATATDDGFVASVEFFVNGVSVGVDTASPYGVTYNVPASGVSSLTITAKATDGSGNNAPSAPVTVSVLGDQPPSVTILSPLNGDGLWAGGDVTVVADARDDVGVTFTQVYLDGESLRGSNVNTAPFSVRIPLPVNQSTVRLSVRATDTAGQSTMSPEVVLTLTPTSAVGAVELPSAASDLRVAENYAYVAAGASGLQVIDVSDPAAPRIAGSLALPGIALEIALAGPVAYIAAKDGGLHLVDVSDPAAPALIGTVPTAGAARGVTVDRERLFVATDIGAQLFDLRNPRAPAWRGSIETPQPANSPRVQGDTLFLGLDDWETMSAGCTNCALVTSWNVSNLAAPVKLDELIVDTEGDDGLPMALSADTLHVLGVVKLISVDISDPSQLSVAGEYDGNLGRWQHCCWAGGSVQGNLLFALTEETPYQGVQLFDVSDPTQLNIVGQIDFEHLPNYFYGKAAVATPELVYIAASDVIWAPPPLRHHFAIGRYRTLEDAGSASPSVSVSYPAANATFFERQGVTLGATAADDVAVASVTFFVDGQPVGTATHAPFTVLWEVPPGPGTRTITARAEDFGGRQTTSTARTVNVVADVTAPTIRITAPPKGATVPAQLLTLRAEAGDDFSVAFVTFTVNGTPVGTDAVWPYEIEYAVPAGMLNLTVGATATDPGSNSAAADPVVVSVVAPQVVGAVAVPGIARRVDLNGSTAYVATSTGLHVVDVANPEAPSIVTTVPLGDARDVRASGNLLFVKTTTTLVVLDVTDRAAPVTLSTTSAFGTTVDLFGTRLLTAHNEEASYDVTDPAAPQLILRRSIGRAGSSSMRMLGPWAMMPSYDSWLGYSDVQAHDVTRLGVSGTGKTFYETNASNQVQWRFYFDVAEDDRNLVAFAHTNGLTLVRFTSNFVAPRFAVDAIGFRALALQDDWILGLHWRDDSGNGDTDAVLFEVSNRSTAAPRVTFPTNAGALRPISVAGSPTHFVIVNEGTSSSSLAAARFRTFDDTFGVPPAVSVTAAGPAVPLRLIHLRASATDDVAVRSVRFTVNGIDAGTDTVAPYEILYRVPAGAVSPLSIGATVTDFAGNEGTATPVSLPLQ